MHVFAGNWDTVKGKRLHRFKEILDVSPTLMESLTSGSANDVLLILTGTKESFVKDAAAQISMFSSEEPPARVSRSLAFARAWLTHGETSHSPILPLLTSIGPNGWSGRMSPEFCRQEEDGTLVPFSGAWSNSGMGSPTECLTLSLCEWTGLDGLSLRDEGVSSLSEILEAGDVPQRYYLSPKACRAAN